MASPQGARVRVRSLIQAGLSDSVEVIFAAGAYIMDAPLELRPEDSGTAAFPIAWKAAAGADVNLSGGKPITSTWTDGGGGIWFTDLAGTGLGPGQWNFRHLFVDGGRATRARFPNKSGPNPFLYATGGGFDHVIINPALVQPGWGDAADAQINAGTHVAHVHFDWLKFRQTSFTLGQIEARVHTDTAIMFENTNDSSIRNSRAKLQVSAPPIRDSRCLWSWIIKCRGLLAGKICPQPRQRIEGGPRSRQRRCRPRRRERPAGPRPRTRPRTGPTGRKWQE